MSYPLPPSVVAAEDLKFKSTFCVAFHGSHVVFISVVWISLPCGMLVGEPAPRDPLLPLYEVFTNTDVLAWFPGRNQFVFIFRNDSPFSYDLVGKLTPPPVQLIAP